jgi:hypothetical protein
MLNFNSIDGRGDKPRPFLTEDEMKRMIDGVESDKTTDFAIDEQADFDAENDLVMYDVCNDYSLSPITTEFDPKLYKTRKHDLGILYIHKEYNEVHYLKAKAGLDGQYI